MAVFDVQAPIRSHQFTIDMFQKYSKMVTRLCMTPEVQFHPVHPGKEYDWAGETEYSDAIISRISTVFPNLTSLNLTGMYFRLDSLRHLSSMPHLVKLRYVFHASDSIILFQVYIQANPLFYSALAPYAMSLNSMEEIGDAQLRLTNIRSLKCNVVTAKISGLTNITSLTIDSASRRRLPRKPQDSAIFVPNPSLDQETFESISQMTQLCELSLRGQAFSTEVVEPLENLTFLDLSYSRVYAIEPLVKLTKLRYLLCSGSDLNPDILDCFAPCATSSLRLLRMQGCTIPSFTFLENACNLETLELEGSRIQGDCSSLAKLTRLRKICISSGGDATKHLGLLKCAPTLSTLWLDAYPLGLEDMKLIAGLTRLESLTLIEKDGLSDEDLKALTSLEFLSHLRITSIKLANGAVEALSCLTSLQKLQLSCPLIQMDIIASLLPGVTVCPS
jgi:Leucine-rich repeat (LRR) protein